MTNKYKYIIGNWKMFGVLGSFNILNQVNLYLKKKKYSKINVVFCIPYTLINFFSKKLIKSNISIGAQDVHHHNSYDACTGSINSYMIKDSGAKYCIVGHSEKRMSGDTDLIINQKIKSCIKNKLKVIFCIGENFKQKKNKTTFKILNNQIKVGLKDISRNNDILVAYEPVWSIGTGITPKNEDLIKNILFIKKKLFKKFKKVTILYGGSVNSHNIQNFSRINDIDGFLVGGASQSYKKFIDIIKKSYK